MLRRSESDDFPKAELSALLPGAQALRMAVYMSAILLPILIFHPAREREGRIRAQCCRKVAPPGQDHIGPGLSLNNAGTARKVLENPRKFNLAERHDAAHGGGFDKTRRDNAKPPALDEAGDARMRTRDQIARATQHDSIVADEMDGAMPTAARHQGEGESALAGPRSPENEQRRSADGDTGRVDRDVRRAHAAGLAAGSHTVNRAPRTGGGSPGPSGVPIRLAAKIVPPCTSMICREIESPRPEFCPKP